MDQLISNLPEEMKHEILECIPAMFPRSSASLRLVSKDVQSWVDQILYSVVVCHHAEHWPPGLNLERFERYAQRVRHILIGFDSTRDASLNEGLLKGLKSCTKIVNLAIWTINGTNKVDYCGHLRPFRLSVPMDILFGSKFVQRGLQGVADHPIFSNVTHLEIYEPEQKWEDWKNLADLPQLTHLSIHEISGEDIAEGAIKECHRLKVIALLSNPTTPFAHGVTCQLDETSYPHVDPRVVSFLWEPTSDWEAHAMGRKDMWVFADELVESRRVNSVADAK
ncbi:hypothetical protein BDN72DRAFT_961412 [Pluteus cervinus]|uniref:Uncharacterized protein n=1 Tax=Pluteus cervinus TaxID=181527 RepID=A0ACD3ANH7_9AGAR|nr:hypothetical protein BDN72DRAFT_961412 [Pluteus cervinus]